MLKVGPVPTVAPAAHDIAANWDNAKSGRHCLRKRNLLKCASPGREMLLIYGMSSKVTKLWESGMCGCFRLTLTQLNCPFIFFKKKQSLHSISQVDTVPPNVGNGVGKVLLLICGFKEEALT